MRALVLVAALPLAAFVLPAQVTVAPPPTDSGVTVVLTAPEAPSRESIRRQLEAVRLELEGRRLPRYGDIVWGSRTVAPGERVRGPLVAAGGLEIHGLVRGDAIALAGDVVIRPGGHVSGDAISAGGRVRVEGGSVDGERLVLAANLFAPAAPVAQVPTFDAVKHRMALSAAWLVMLLLIGIGVLVFAGNYLDGVVAQLEKNFTRSLWAGIGGQLALIPALVVLVLALVLTLIGILLVPFAVVAFVLAVTGLCTLGYLAVARVAGMSLLRSPPGLSARGQSLRTVVVGLVALIGIWFLASALFWIPILGWAMQGVAFAISWVAATAGFGAAILSRAGTRQEEEDEKAPARTEPSAPDVGWQTPTPVTGVAAARRPTPVARTNR
jgi:hypothetical protein